MRRIQTIAQVLQRMLPLSWAGWCLALTAAVTWLWSHTLGRDEVANALGFCLGTLLLLLILCNYLAQFLASRVGSGPPQLHMRLPHSLWQTTTSSGTETTSGWSTSSPILLRLGLVTISTVWKKADASGQSTVQGRLDAAGQEHVAVTRRGAFDFRRQLILRDVFHLTYTRLNVGGFTRVAIAPPETARLGSLQAAFPDSDEGWSQYGKRCGDYFDILTADPQTPRRLLLWKLSLKSGATTIKYRRAPEPVARQRRRLGVFFQVTPADEPAAAFLCHSLTAPQDTENLFGTDWLFADSLDPGKLQPGQATGARAISWRLMQSGSREIPPATLGAQPLATFVLKCRQQGIVDVWVFHGPDWSPAAAPQLGPASSLGGGSLQSSVSGVSATFFRVVTSPGSPASTRGINLRALPRQPSHFEIIVS